MGLSPCRKISWYRSMSDRIDHENALKEKEEKQRKQQPKKGKKS